MYVCITDAAGTVLVHENLRISQQARHHDPSAVLLLRTIPGIGITLALTILYEIGDIARFPPVGNFISYARLVKCAHESAGKRVNGRNNKIGKAKALSIIAQRLGRTTYIILKRRTASDQSRFFESLN